MTTIEIRDAISRLQEMEYLLEEEYENNGGEVTDYTEQQEEAIAALRRLLTTEGVDSLGRWLKSKEDAIKSLKAEKDSINRQIANINKTIDYIKGQMHTLLLSAGMDKLKGTCYTFTPYMSVKSEVDKDTLRIFYEDKVKDALTMAHIPPYIGVTLTASASKAKALGVVPGDEELFHETQTPTVRFTKPRASKEDVE